MGPKQRKNTKKQGNTATKGDGKVDDVGLELDKALTALAKGRARMLDLYIQWRTQLFRMSLMVMVFVIHQAQQPTIPCLKEIKYWNEIKKNSSEEPIGGLEAAIIVLSDSITEILGLFCCTMLLWMLNLPITHADFQTIQFRLSSIVIPLIAWQYNENRIIGCLDDETMTILMQDTTVRNNNKDMELPDERKERQFPIILVFYAITTICLYFMQYHGKRMEENIQTLLKLKKDLTDQRQELASKKKA